MHTYRILLAGLFCLNAAPASSAPAAMSPAQARRTIQREMNAMDVGFARKDLAGAYAFYASDYHRVDLTGKAFDLASDKQGAAHFFPAMQASHATNRIQSLTMAGGRATVSLVTDAQILIQPQGSQKPVTLDDHETRSQTWLASGKSWLLQNSRTISSRQVVHAGGKTNVIVNGKQQ